MNALDALTRLVAKLDSYPELDPTLEQLVSDARPALKAETPVVSNDARAIIGGFVDLLKRVGVVKGSDAERLMLQAADFLDGPCKGDADEAARFWRGVSAPDGMTAGEVEVELTGYRFLMEQASLVYRHATGGLPMGANYPAATVKAVIDNYVKGLVERAVREDQAKTLKPARVKLIELAETMGLNLEEDLHDY